MRITCAYINATLYSSSKKIQCPKKSSFAFLRDSTMLIPSSSTMYVMWIKICLLAFLYCWLPLHQKMDIHFEYTKNWHMRYPLNSLSILRWMNFHSFIFFLLDENFKFWCPMDKQKNCVNHLLFCWKNEIFRVNNFDKNQSKCIQ